MDECFIPPEADGRPVVEAVHGRGLPGLEAKHRSLFHHLLVKEEIRLVKPDRHVEGILGCRDTGHVIDVSVREQHQADVEVEIANRRQQLVDLVTRIDQDRLVRLLAAQYEAVLVERRNSPDFDNHSTLQPPAPAPAPAPSPQPPAPK
jgi:hypothetical protein